MTPPPYLIFDTETGGLYPATSSLLTASFRIVHGETLETVSDLHLAILPANGRYETCDEAMAVNGIDLAEHHRTAVSRDRAWLDLTVFLAAHQPVGDDLYPLWRYTPVGWNMPFDLRFLFAQFCDMSDWNWYVGDRLCDLYQHFKRRNGAGGSGKLTDVARHYGLDVSDAHTASGDVELTHQLLRRFVREPAGQAHFGGLAEKSLQIVFPE